MGWQNLLYTFCTFYFWHSELNFSITKSKPNKSYWSMTTGLKNQMSQSWYKASFWSSCSRYTIQSAGKRAWEYYSLLIGWARVAKSFPKLVRYCFIMSVFNFSYLTHIWETWQTDSHRRTSNNVSVVDFPNLVCQFFLEWVFSAESKWK